MGTGRRRGQPWKHQREARDRIARDRAAVLYWDMGTGKTRPTLEAMADVLGEAPHQRWALVLAPKAVLGVWAEQAKLYAPALKVLVLNGGSVARRAKQFDEALRLHRVKRQPFVVVINYDSFWRPPFFSAVQAAEPHMLIFDECHKLKSPRGRASKAAWLLPRQHTVGLTGTLMPHSPADIWAIYRAIDARIFGTSFVRFRSYFAEMGGYQQHEIVGWRHQDELRAKIQSIAMRVQKSDAGLDLPPTTDERITVELTGEAAKAYAVLDARFSVDVQAGRVSITNALTRLLRMQQITGGSVQVDEREGVVAIAGGDGKFNALCELFEDLDRTEPVVVFCRFRWDLAEAQRAAEAVGRQYFELSGRFNELERWQRDDGGSVIGVQVQSGGMGVSMVRACYCVFYSLGYSLGDYLQARARLDRPGQTRPVTYYHLVAANTIDHAVYATLRKREAVVESILKERGAVAAAAG